MRSIIFGLGQKRNQVKKSTPGSGTVREENWRNNPAGRERAEYRSGVAEPGLEVEGGRMPDFLCLPWHPELCEA